MYSTYIIRLRIHVQENLKLRYIQENPFFIPFISSSNYLLNSLPYHLVRIAYESPAPLIIQKPFSNRVYYYHTVIYSPSIHY